MGNWQCERYNRTMQGLLRTLTPAHQVARLYLPELTYAYNVTPHAATGFSPFYLMFGRVPRLPIDIRLHNDRHSSTSQTVRGTNMNWVDYHQSKLKSACAKATEQLELDIANRRASYDKHTREDTLQIGDHVHLRNRVKGRNKIGDACHGTWQCM